MPWRRAPSHRAAATSSPPRRRGAAFASTALCGKGSWAGPHQERRTVDDSEYQGREAIVLSSRPPNDLPHGRCVVIVDTTPQREREQLFRHRANERLGTLEQRTLQPGDAEKLAAVGQA